MGTANRKVLAALAALTLSLPNVYAAAAGNEFGVAVIIGNKEYADDRFSDVSYAHNDAEAFKRFVTGELGFDANRVIHLPDATKTDMEGAFGVKGNEKGRLWQWMRRDGSSDVVVFYSGHGMEGSISDTGRRPDYLLPVDANKDTAELNGYPIELLYENLGKLPSKSMTVYLDACFSGVAGESVADASPVSRGADISGVSGAGFAVLTAASGNQLASWDSEARHGLFTEHLLDGLYGAADADGDRRVTAREAKLYLDDKMTLAARSKHRREQDAGLYGDSSAVLSLSSAGGWSSRPPKAGDSFQDCPECPEMVVIPAGSYLMGYKPGRDPELEVPPNAHVPPEGPVREVTIATSFAIGRYEVTVAEFGQFVEETGYRAGVWWLRGESARWKDCRSLESIGEKPKDWRNPGFGQSARHPVVCVTWDDAQAYTSWLSTKTGQRYRLPSESEWEYAARAGTATARHWGEEDQCRYANGGDASLKELDADTREDVDWPTASCSDGHPYTAPVGEFPANGWRLHDMLGNVREWTEDCWNVGHVPPDGSALKPPVYIIDDDPWNMDMVEQRPDGECRGHVARGCSWEGFPSPSCVRAATRIPTLPDPTNIGGFRVARTLAP